MNVNKSFRLIKVWELVLKTVIIKNMSKHLFFVCCFFVLTNLAYSQHYKPLFNNVDLLGWKIDRIEKWYVENGELVARAALIKNLDT